MKNSRMITRFLLMFALFTAGCDRHQAVAQLQPRLPGDTGATIASLQGAANSPEESDSASKPQQTSAAEYADIARLTTAILSQKHYLHHPLDGEFAGRLLARYLDALDPQRLYFLQSDVDEFDALRPKLGDMLKHGDTSPANQIFSRFLERVDQQTAYAKQLLKSEQFTFNGNDTYVLDRKTMPRPKDLDAAQQLWRERLRYEYLQEKLNKQKPEEIVKALTRRYDRVARTCHEYDNDSVFQLYLDALAHAYDPHSDYMGKETLETFGIQMKLSLVGIGALLQESEDGYPKIIELIPGGPAARSKQMKPGDRIVTVAQENGQPVDVVDMKLDKVVELIRGPKGTKVRLSIIPADAPDPSTRKTIVLTRDEVKLEEQEAKARLVELPVEQGKTLRLGVIDLPSFYADLQARTQSHKSTTADVAKLLRKLKAEKVDGIVLDLRRNGGGSLEEAIRLTGLFIKKGPVVQVKDSDSRVQVDEDPDPTVLYDGPLVVLTSRLSASASEILAGALQDYGRALIVGDTSTFGKGTVQAVLELAGIMERTGASLQADPGAIKLTIEKFYRPSGASTQLKGVVSDIVVPALTNYVDVGEKSLDNPLPWDSIRSAPYEKLNRVQPYLAELRRRSTDRVTHDKDFAFLSREIDRFKQMLARKVVSLNEEQRLKEKQEADALLQARKKELASRPASKAKVYVITLKQADQPGLPPPTTEAALSKAEAQKSLAMADETDSTTANQSLPALDTTLEETERILADLVLLSHKPATSAAR